MRSTPTSNVRYITFSMSFNENELRTHETNLGQAGCGTFTLPEMVTTQVKVVKGLYTEVRNVQHVARGRVSRVFVLIDRESFE